jgi:uncharacterized protein (TIGR03790 family)
MSRSLRRLLVAVGAVLSPALAQAGDAATILQAPVREMPSAESSASAASAASAAARRWVAVPVVTARLTARDIGLVINAADPYSVAVGEHYARRRGLGEEQVLRVDLPVVPALDRDAFLALRSAIDARFGPEVQALALAWTAPYAVECHSITGALALGLTDGLCARSCASTPRSVLFNDGSARPFDRHRVRPSMLLAARSIDQGRALIDRGVAADGALRRDPTGATALFLEGTDVARGVRARLYPPSGRFTPSGVEVVVARGDALAATPRVVVAQTGSVRLDAPGPIDWAPGGLGDHVTSFGGALLGTHGQGTVLDWLEAGATASHGTVSEPCNHPQKFPHPQVLLLNYLQGATALEAYWRSVAWPLQSLFVGEPLAAPFAPAGAGVWMPFAPIRFEPAAASATEGAR